MAGSPVIRCRQADTSTVSLPTDSCLAEGEDDRNWSFRRLGIRRDVNMSEQDLTPDKDDDDTKGHVRHHFADDDDDDDTEGHVRHH